MKHSLNGTVLFFLIVILFICGRIIYLSTVEKYFGEKKTIAAKIKSDAAIQVLMAVGFSQLVMDLAQYYFNSAIIKGLVLGLLAVAAALIIFIRMRRDKKIRAQVIKGWGKTGPGTRLYLIFLGLFTVYTFIKSVRDLFIS